MRGAIWAAYDDTNALQVRCGHCGAEPGHWCTREDGRVRRTPCVSRIVVASVIPGTDDKYGRDFSQPTHRSERNHQ